VDIDNFKQINDSLGHADGDILLATVARRLQSSVHGSDTVARLGGDEFVIMIHEFRTIHDVEQCAHQIMRNASEPIEIRGREISLTLSVGIATLPEGGRTAEELLRNADAAMYSVKDTGRNSLCVFNERLLVASLATASFTGRGSETRAALLVERDQLAIDRRRPALCRRRS